MPRLLTVLLSLLLAPIGVALAEVPLADFARNDSFDDASISPDGHYVALTVPVADGRGVAVLDLKNSTIHIGGLITPTLNSTVKLQKVIGLPEVFSATTTASSTAVTTSKKGLLVGQTVTGTGIAASTTIAAITATGFTLSANATASGTVDVTVTGAADITAAATVAATAATAATAAQAVPFVPINGGPPVAVKKGDKLRFVLVAVTSLGIGRTIIPLIPYVSRLAPGLNP